MNTANPIGSGAKTLLQFITIRNIRERERERGCDQSYGNVGVAGIALGIRGGEDGVDEDERADNLRCETRSLGISCGERVCSAAISIEVSRLEALD